jgi:hypothetical protein
MSLRMRTYYDCHAVCTDNAWTMLGPSGSRSHRHRHRQWVGEKGREELSSSHLWTPHAYSSSLGAETRGILAHNKVIQRIKQKKKL